MNQKEKLKELIARYNDLYKKHHAFSKELLSLKEEIIVLKKDYNEGITQQESTKEAETDFVPELKYKTSEEGSQLTETKKTPSPKAKKPFQVKSDLEKFIGENLMLKVGILILIIGVGIGAKFTIENDLISPLTRIVLGYAVGLGLLGFGFKLKVKYENFSAVLVSGAMAIMYLITFFAYSFYGLIPSGIAFALMLIFTAFTVFAAIQYDRQVIAHIGLVGAYAVPFLLSNDSGNVLVLFSYIAIINVGILIVALNRYWKSLYYSAFVFTWLIFGTWFSFDYEPKEDFGTAFTFAAIYFVLFYLTFLAYKIYQKEQFSIFDIILLTVNSFVFYGIGYMLLDGQEGGEELLGLFTLGNALVHFIVSVVIYRQKLGKKSLLYFVSGLVLVFITIAIPVQLDGNWVTLLWAMEAALLFWLGRSKDIPAYEIISYPLMILASASILDDWDNVYRASS